MSAKEPHESAKEPTVVQISDIVAAVSWVLVCLNICKRVP